MKKHLLLSLALMLTVATWFTACNTPSSTTESTADTLAATPVNSAGLALYTVRDSMATNPKVTLKAVADAGYVNVEAAGYAEGKFYGMAPADFKAYLDSLGLKAKSAHMGMVTMENADQLIADTRAAGIEYFVIPVPPMGMFTFDRETMTMGMKGTPAEIAGILDTLGAKCKAAGLQLLYHNHDFEFKPMADGTVLIDYLLANCNPEYVNFQMDLFWVTKAGADPLAYFTKYPGRFKSWHVKDMDAEGKFAAVGTGTIDFRRILAAKAQSGMQFYLVEQDNTFDLAPLEAIKISRKGLTDIGFE